MILLPLVAIPSSHTKKKRGAKLASVGAVLENGATSEGGTVLFFDSAYFPGGGTPDSNAHCCFDMQGKVR